MAQGDPAIADSVMTPSPAPLVPGGLPNTPLLVAIPLPDGDIIYHNGQLLPSPNVDCDPDQTFNFGPYSITGQNGQTISVPCHWHQAWWVDWKTLPQVINSPAQVVAQRWMFPYGNIGVPAGIPSSFAPYTIMGSSDVTIYMPTTGERGDIGLITDKSAQFMLTGSADAMIAWANAGLSCPDKFRDQTTGQCVDLLTYFTGNSYDAPGAGGPWWPKGPRDIANHGGYSVCGGDWVPQQAHFPELNYLAHKATGKLVYLLALQYHGNYTVLADATGSARAGNAVIYGEQRGLAWALRNLFMAHKATADAEAAGLKTGDGTSFKSASYFQTLLDQTRAEIASTLTDPSNQLFKVVPLSYRFGPWQQAYVVRTLGFGLLTGRSEWEAVYIFALGCLVAMMNGTSGYPPGWGSAYYLNTCPWQKNPDGSLNLGAYDTATQFSWYDSFLYQQNDTSSLMPTADQIAALKVDQFNGGIPITGGEYLMDIRACFAEAKYLDDLGIVSVRAAYQELDACYATCHGYVMHGGYVDARSSVVASLSPPPPPTEIHMSATKLRVGETKHVTLAITPADADQTGLTYVAAPDGIVTLTPDLSGVAVTRTAPGVATITASLNGLTATAEADDAAPLALSLALSWDS